MWLFQLLVVHLEVLLRGESNYCFNKENFKIGVVCIICGEISEGSGPEFPPWLLH